jgi:head-tail adaptor
MNAGRMNDRVRLQERGETRWEVRATVWAEITYLRGSESVIAGRLAGRNTVVIRVRRSALTMSMKTTSWRIRNDKTSEVYNIKSLIPSPDYVDFTCEAE